MGNVGYCTVLAGRMHFKGPDRFHGFHERLVGDIGDPSWNGGQKNKREVKKYHQYGAGHAVLDESGPGISRLLAYDQAVLDAACDRLRLYASQQESSEAQLPLFMTVGFYGPHNPYVCDPELYHYYYDTLPRLPFARSA